MSESTGISWTDSTWNPIRGCQVVSPGCTNCYAMEVAARFSGPGLPYEGLARRTKDGKAIWTGKAMLVESHLNDPIRWQKPRRIFVNSMSDVFFEQVPDEYIDRMFDVMEQCPRHTFQILTKRPERMRDYMKRRARYDGQYDGRFIDRTGGFWIKQNPHIWLGVSVEDQRRAEERIPILLKTPAAVRFLSCEPLLGPLRLSSWLWKRHDDVTPAYWTPGAIRRQWPDNEHWFVPRGDLHWIIDGGESGRNHRPDDQGWYRSIRDQCVEAGVAYFHKQSAGPWSGTGVELDGQIWHQFPAAERGVRHDR